MNPFSLYLRKLQADLGFPSAKSFYEYLSSAGPLNFNYTYYMKIEGSKQIPSPSIVQRIASILPRGYQDALTLAYCATLFPERADLFHAREPVTGSPGADVATPPKKTFSKHEVNSKVSKSKQISLSQFDAITRTRTHYFLFLLFTQARRPLRPEEIEHYFPAHEYTSAVTDLLASKVLFGSPEAGFRTVVDDLKFPVPDSEFLQAAYDRMTPWDKEFPAHFEMAPDFTRLHLRRCSQKSAVLLKAHLRLLNDLAFAAEDSNEDLNQEVFFLDLYFSLGKLPG